VALNKSRLARQALVWGVGIALLRSTVVPAEHCPPADAAAVRAAAAAASAWLVRGQMPDGRFLYLADRHDRPIGDEYNDTRHAGVLTALYRTGQLQAADKGLRYVQARISPSGGFDDDTGATALTLIALVHRRAATGDPRYDALMRRLGRFLAGQVQPDGSVLLYRGDPRTHGQYSTGEAMYALALLARTFPGERWDLPARRIANYIATRRDEAEGYTIRLDDHWGAYGLELLKPLSPTLVEYAHFLAGSFGYEIRAEAGRGRRIVEPLTGSGSELGTAGEGAAALWRLAGEDPRLADLRAPLAARIRCLAGITVRDQSSDGAWHARSGETRMDDQQHAIGGLLGAEQVVQ
jgi:hypothetical protein